MSSITDLKDNPSLLWDVSITSPNGVHCDLKGVTYAEAWAVFDGVLQSTPDDNLREMLQGCVPLFGVTGRSKGEYRVDTNAYARREATGETHLCPRRSEGGPGPSLSDHDTWDRVGKDRVCSYCGSLHPDEMLARMKEHGLNAIDPSTKGYKWYLADHPLNAGMGAIKYYRMHDTPELLACLKALVDAQPSEPTP